MGITFGGITLRVLFEGLIGFVPEVDDSGKIVAMNALLVDARGEIESQILNDKGALLKHVQHFPVARVRRADVVKISASPNDNISEKDGVVIWELNRDWLDIVPDGEIVEVNRSLDVNARLGLKPPRPTSDEEHADVRWIPQLDDFAASSAEASVRVDVVRPKDHAVLDSLVAAQIRFTKGRFFAEPSSISDVVYEFVPLPQAISTASKPANPKAAHQAVAAFGVLETAYKIPDTSLVGGTLHLKSARTGGYLDLSPSIGSTVEVVLSNVPVPGSKPTVDFDAYPDHVVDFDYELMYQLSAKTPQAISVPAGLKNLLVGGGDFRPCGNGGFRAIKAES
jgi:hypothetical protein